MAYDWDPKHPSDVDTFYFIFCDDDGTNDGSTSDDGLLQGATISSLDSVTADTGLTVDSTSTATVTIQGTVYAVNTVAHATLSGGTDGETYNVTAAITTSDGRTIYRVRQLRVSSSV